VGVGHRQGPLARANQRPTCARRQVGVEVTRRVTPEHRPALDEFVRPEDNDDAAAVAQELHNAPRKWKVKETLEEVCIYLMRN
jgi:hypothetical protein